MGWHIGYRKGFVLFSHKTSGNSWQPLLEMAWSLVLFPLLKYGKLEFLHPSIYILLNCKVCWSLGKSKPNPAYPGWEEWCNHNRDIALLFLLPAQKARWEVAALMASMTSHACICLPREGLLDSDIAECGVNIPHKVGAHNSNRLILKAIFNPSALYSLSEEGGDHIWGKADHLW